MIFLMIIAYSTTRNVTVASIAGLLGLGLVWYKEYLPDNYCFVATIVLVVIIIADNVGGRG